MTWQHADSTNHLLTQDVYIGDSTTVLVLHHHEEGRVQCCSILSRGNKLLHCSCKKNFRKFMHTSYTFLSKAYRQCPNLHLTYLRRAFDKATVKLEHREFMLDSEVTSFGEWGCSWFLVKESHLKSPMGEQKYLNLSTLALKLLSTIIKCWRWESFFIGKIEFRSSLHVETLL